MFYITYVYDKTNTNEQLSFEDLFNADGSIKTLSVLPSINTHTEYKTICTQFLLPRTQTFFDRQAQQFTNQFAEKLSFYADKDMHEFYTEFSIPKHSGGFRTINAPKEDLKRFQREMKDFLWCVYCSEATRVLWDAEFCVELVHVFVCIEVEFFCKLVCKLLCLSVEKCLCSRQ